MLFLFISWGIRLILEALISFLPTPADGAIGALDWTSAERKRLAKASVNYHCAACGCKAIELLPELKPNSEEDAEEEDAVKAKKNKKAFMFQKEIEKLQQLQSLEHAQKETEEGGSATAAAAKTSTDDDGKTTDEGAKETEKKPATEENSGDKEPALVVDDASASSKVKFSETTTPSPKPTTPKDADTQEKSTTNTTSNTTATSTTLDNSELERACREDPETIRRQLLQGATPCSLRGEKRVEFEQRRIRQYYEHILKAGREIDWEAKARFEKEQEEHRAKEQEFEQQEALELAAQKVLEAQQRAVQEEQQQQQEPHRVPLVQERLDGPVPPRQEQIPQMQQPAIPARDDLFSWILDPVLHGIIATLAVLCFLLLRKLQGMVAELNDLNELLEKS